MNRKSNTIEMIRNAGRISLLVLACLAGVNSSLSGQNQNVTTYQNPVIPGDIPDPTVIRVGKMYYAAGTTSDFAPNYPIYDWNGQLNRYNLRKDISEKN